MCVSDSAVAHSSLEIFHSRCTGFWTYIYYHIGCACGEDRQSHYAQCPFLYSLFLQLRPHNTPSCPVKRLGLVSPDREVLLAISCTFSGYHAIKRSNFVVGLSHMPLDPSQRSAAHILFAEAFRASALEVQLPCKARLVAT